MNNQEELYKNTYKFIQERKTELLEMAISFSKTANKASKPANIIQVLVILLGAIIAAKAGLDRLISASSLLSLEIYTIIGILIAVLTGLESAFKWQRKAAELRLLASSCRATAREIDHKLKIVLMQSTDGAISRESLKASTDLLSNLDETIGKIQTSAANLGINLDDNK